MGRMPDGPAHSNRIHYLIAALIAALVIAASVTGFAWADNDVTVTVDGASKQVSSRAADVAELLRDNGVSLRAGDVVNPAAETALRDGLVVTVRHAVPVQVVLGDRTLELDVVGSTVADALIAAGADPTAGIAVDPPVSAPLRAHMRITTTDVFVRVLQKECSIPFAVRTVKDSDKPRGYREVRRKGRDGRLLQVFRVVVSAGQEGRPVLQAERTVTQPADQVVVVGGARSDSVLIASRGSSSPPREGRRIRVVSTAYAPGSGGADHTTATGARARKGVIAVDPSVIPLGTHVYVPGYGYAVAADTGGAITGNRIDVCFDTRAEALAWGRRTVTIVILP